MSAGGQSSPGGATTSSVLSEPIEGESLPCVATIGVFDGVHLGHQALIRAVRERAEALGVASLLITFDPHPVAVLAPHLPPQRIGVRPVESRWLAETGVDRVWFLPFSKAMSAWSPERFLGHLLDRLELRELWVGYDFRFGRKRAGDAAFLQKRGQALGFGVRVFDAVAAAAETEERVYSSTWVRECLRDGDLATAEAVLGHPFEIQGTVVRGQGLGSRDLVPTANLELASSQLIPRDGIYVGWSALEEPATWLPSVANVGRRPTVEASGDRLVEVHLIDWDGDIYGRELRFRFGEWLRPEEAYPGLAELREAIDRDLREARVWFNTRSD